MSDFEKLHEVELAVESFSWERIEDITSSKQPYVHNQSFILVGLKIISLYKDLVESVFGVGEIRVTGDRALQGLIDRHLEDVANGIASSSETEKNFRRLKETVKSDPIEDYIVCERVYGLTIEGLQEPVNIGALTILSLPDHAEQVYGDVAHEDFRRLDPGLYVRVSVQSRTPKWAISAALEDFRRFENAFQFVIGLGDHYNVSVGLDKKAVHWKAFARSPTRQIFSSSRTGPFEPLRIKMNDFAYNGSLHRLLLTCMENNPSELQARIRRSVNWLGQASSDPVISSAFIKAMTALETMLVLGKPGAISSSIASQISEQAAHILGSTVEEKLQIEKDVKHLYGKRSAIVHSGNSVGSEREFKSLFTICKNIVNRFIFDESLSKLHTSLKLDAYFRERKYRG